VGLACGGAAPRICISIEQEDCDVTGGRKFNEKLLPVSLSKFLTSFDSSFSFLYGISLCLTRIFRSSLKSLILMTVSWNKEISLLYILFMCFSIKTAPFSYEEQGFRKGSF
jgi:hypothetical protein